VNVHSRTMAGVAGKGAADPAAGVAGRGPAAHAAQPAKHAAQRSLAQQEHTCNLCWFMPGCTMPELLQLQQLCNLSRDLSMCVRCCGFGSAHNAEAVDSNGGLLCGYGLCRQRFASR
jgi:hypothetical protein